MEMQVQLSATNVLHPKRLNTLYEFTRPYRGFPQELALSMAGFEPLAVGCFLGGIV